jgi:hypothetical protein
MKLFVRFYLFLLFIILACGTQAQQCIINSPCGYTVRIGVVPRAIIPSVNPCPFGYNYNVRFDYTIVVTGVNTCFNGNIGIQPQILCGTQNNGYFTINVPAPTVGSPSSTNTYTGTLTTSSNPFRNTTDCATATPVSLGCSNLQITIFGPGIASSTINCAAGPLAVNLTSFKGVAQKNTSILKWSTASESGNKAFSIQHSIDGINFSDIGAVNGSNNSSTNKNYSFIHNEAKNGKNYYRLKIIANDNSFTYSTIISTYNDFDPSALTVNTTVTNNEVVISTSNNNEIYLLNLSGQQIMALKKGTNNLASLPAGMYFIKAGAAVVKIIKY